MHDPKLIEDILGGVFLVLYLLKFAVNPSRTELRVVSQFLYFLIVVLSRIVSRHKSSADLKPHTSAIKSELRILKSKLQHVRTDLGVG